MPVLLKDIFPVELRTVRQRIKEEKRNDVFPMVLLGQQYQDLNGVFYFDKFGLSPFRFLFVWRERTVV